MCALITFPAWDTDLFLYLNACRVSWLDPIMWALSSATFWIPCYLLLAYFMVKRGMAGIWAFAFLVLTFALVDQLSVHLFKNQFMRLRPCHNPAIQHLVQMLEDCGGQFGFISNHASNSFSLALFVCLFFKNKLLSVGLFVWSSAVAYSRIYVGKHYPLDLIFGALFGLLCAALMFKLYTWTWNRWGEKICNFKKISIDKLRKREYR